jgi:hypothetical protein
VGAVSSSDTDVARADQLVLRAAVDAGLAASWVAGEEVYGD